MLCCATGVTAQAWLFGRYGQLKGGTSGVDWGVHRGGRGQLWVVGTLRDGYGQPRYMGRTRERESTVAHKTKSAGQSFSKVVVCTRSVNDPTVARHSWSGHWLSCALVQWMTRLSLATADPDTDCRVHSFCDNYLSLHLIGTKLIWQKQVKGLGTERSSARNGIV